MLNMLFSLEIKKKSNSRGFTHALTFKNKKKLVTGFTLIELLVVIAIIGILSAIVLSSLSSTNSKGKDAAIKSNLINARTKAQVYFDTNVINPNSFTAVCSPTPTYSAIGINKIILAAVKITNQGQTSVSSGAATWNTGKCNATATEWAAQVPLTGSTLAEPRMLCVDSTGTLKETSILLTASTGTTYSVCP